MRTRTYGALMLALVGMAPLAVYGYIAIERSQRTAVSEVRQGNDRLARSIAERIEEYVERERELIESIGSAVLQERDAGDAQALVDAYELRYRYFSGIEVYRDDGELWVARDPDDAALAQRALLEGPVQTDIRPARDKGAAGYAHTLKMAVPVEIAGRLEGAVVARLDLVGVWPPVNDVTVGDTGFVRLLGTDGELLAHGDPEERRWVFDAEPDDDARLVAAALLRGTAPNRQHADVVSSVAFVPGTHWVVLVEQNVSEAFAAAAAMKRDLALFGAGVVALVLILGVAFGRYIVRGLEALRAHTRILARGDLEARVHPKTRLVEVQELADSLNDMAASLKQLQDEARARERLTTFARVAAGLAHDLRQPIEALRAAHAELVTEPDDPGAWRYWETIGGRDLPRLKRFVDDLQRLARTGDLSTEREPVDPVALADEVVDDLSANPKWAGVEFAAEGRGDRILADHDLVRRALVNLAGNAADACSETGPDGHVQIRIEDGAEALRLSVIDDGPGIDPGRVTDLISGDFQTTKRTSGVGLGIGVVRQVAEAHGGVLEVSSEVGRGSTFVLVLPRGVSGERSTGVETAGRGGAAPRERTSRDETDEATDEDERGDHGPRQDLAG